MGAYKLIWNLYSLICEVKHQDIIGLLEVFQLIIMELGSVGFQTESDWSTNVTSKNKDKPIWDLGEAFIPLINISLFPYEIQH